MAVLALGYLAVIYTGFKKKDYDHTLLFLTLVFTITITILITAIINPFIKEWLLDPGYGVITKVFDIRKAIFATFLILMLKDNKRIIKNLEISSFITFIYMVVQIGLFLYTRSWINYYMVRDDSLVLHNYNMSLGYELIFVSLVFFHKSSKDKSLKALLLGAVSFFCSFYFGSRGVLLPIISFFILTFIFNSKRDKKILLVKQIAITIVIFIVLLNVLGLVESKLLLMNKERDPLMMDPDSQSRNVEMLLSSDFVSGNGRNIIYSISMEAIKNKFPLGYGVYGDRPFVGDRFRWGYSHNIFLELLVSFGIFGLIIILGLLYLILTILIKKKYRDYRGLAIVLLSMNSKLLISDTFWYLDFFWALMGLLMVIYMNDKKINVRFFAYTIPSLIIVNILLLGMFINVDAKRQIYNTINIDEPTVILTFDAGYDTNPKMYDVLRDRALKGTSFINIDGLSDSLEGHNALKELEDYGWDFQDLIEDRSLNNMSSKELGAKIQDNKKGFKELGLKEPRIIAPVYDETKLDAIFKISPHIGGIRLMDRVRSVYYYTRLKPSDFYKLGALNIGVPEGRNGSLENRLSLVKRQIDIAQRTKSLLILYVDRQGFIQGYGNGEEAEHLETIVSYLEEKGFKFKTIGEILGEAEIAPKDRTLINYLKRNNPIKTLSN